MGGGKGEVALIPRRILAEAGPTERTDVETGPKMVRSAFWRAGGKRGNACGKKRDGSLGSSDDKKEGVQSSPGQFDRSWCRKKGTLT